MSIPLWILPRELCGDTKIAINADHILKFKGKLRGINSRSCFFTSSRASAELKIIVKNSRSQFYAQKIDNPVKNCSIGVECHHQSNGPLFLSIDTPRTESLELQMSLQSKGDNFCGFSAIPQLINDQMQPRGDEFPFLCKSLRHSVMHLVKMALVLAFGVATLILTLHLTNVIRISWPCQTEEDKRFESIKRSPYAVEIVNQSEEMSV